MELGFSGHHFCGVRCKKSSLALAQRSWDHRAGLRSPHWPKSASSVKAPAGQSTREGSCCPGKFISTSGHPVAIGRERPAAGGQESDLRSASAEPSEGEREQVQARSAGQCQPWAPNQATAEQAGQSQHSDADQASESLAEARELPPSPGVPSSDPGCCLRTQTAHPWL